MRETEKYGTREIEIETESAITSRGKVIPRRDVMSSMYFAKDISLYVFYMIPVYPGIAFGGTVMTCSRCLHLRTGIYSDNCLPVSNVRAQRRFFSDSYCMEAPVRASPLNLLVSCAIASIVAADIYSLYCVPSIVFLESTACMHWCMRYLNLPSVEDTSFDND